MCTTRSITTNVWPLHTNRCIAYIMQSIFNVIVGMWWIEIQLLWWNIWIHQSRNWKWNRGRANTFHHLHCMCRWTIAMMAILMTSKCMKTMCNYWKWNDRNEKSIWLQSRAHSIQWCHFYHIPFRSEFARLFSRHTLSLYTSALPYYDFDTMVAAAMPISYIDVVSPVEAVCLEHVFFIKTNP